MNPNVFAGAIAITGALTKVGLAFLVRGHRQTNSPG
jgi:hypothetical protein